MKLVHEMDQWLQTLSHLLNSVNNLNFLNSMHHQVLTLTASANKLSKILERVDEYTALIMEELDPDNLGYIEVHPLALLAQIGRAHV